MGFWSKLFGKDKEVPISQPVPEVSQEEINAQIEKEWQPSEPIEEREFINRPCCICNKIIGTDKRKKIQGQDFHRVCYKAEKRKAILAGKI